MEKAFLNGNIIYASDVKENYKYEKHIREYSSKGMLKCPDKYCSFPTLKYCHGNKKEPYFAHKCNSSCDYDRYDKNNSLTVNYVKYILYTLLLEKGVKVDVDVKVSEHHYAHLVIEGKYAFELLTDSITTRKIDKIVKEYENNEIKFFPIVVGNDYNLKCESNANYARRFSLNETANNELFVISENGTEIYQYKLDVFKYDYCGDNIFEWDSLYYEKGELEDLTYEDGRLSIEGFISRYGQWIEEKKNKYNMFLAPKVIEKKIHKEKETSRKIYKEIIRPKFSFDYTTPQNISDLYFITNIASPKATVELVEWSEDDFLIKLGRICYDKDEVVFKHLIIKFRNPTDEEKGIINKLWRKFKNERKDYFYILKTAYEKSK